MKMLVKPVQFVGQFFGLVVGRNFILPVDQTLEEYWCLSWYA